LYSGLADGNKGRQEEGYCKNISSHMRAIG
jgi:hypothetical protein